MLPGGFAQAILGQSATPETVAAFNHEIGLDRPAIVRYLEWMAGVLQGDFGYSYAGLGGTVKREVAHLIAPRLYNSFFPCHLHRTDRRPAGPVPRDVDRALS